MLCQRPGRTGSGVFLQHLARVASARGMRQACVAGLAPGDDTSEQGLPPDVRWFPARFQSEELPFPVVGMSDVMPYPSTRWQDLTEPMLAQWRAAFTRQIATAIEEFRPDAILSHHVWLLSGLVKELAPHVPMLTFCHGTGLRQLDLARQLAPAAVESCRHLPHVFALTGAQRESIASRYGVPAARIAVTGGAYDHSTFFAPATPPATDELRVAYAGKLSMAKGLLPLLEAWDALPCELAPCSLTLAGSATGPQADAIRARAARCRHPVHLPGALPQRELAELFRRSHVFVLPSYYEGLPLVLVEALACGARAVCTDLPGVRHWCGPAICDRVRWVELPALRTIDEPDPAGLPAFTARLRDAIVAQLVAARAGVPLDAACLENFLRPRTWEGLFDRIEETLS